jgi:hypothetical protein
MIILQEGSDPGLNPYALEFSGAAVGSIHETIKNLENQIDLIANTGGIRIKQTREVSGVALQTEFQLLNAKLAGKADQMELAEEQIWRLFGVYQNKEWEGEVEYPDNFDIKDTEREIDTLVKAKSAATDPRVLRLIDHEVVEVLGEEADIIIPEGEIIDAAALPAVKPFEPHIMYNPDTGLKVIARTEQEHIAYMEQGYIHEED